MWYRRSVMLRKSRHRTRFCLHHHQCKRLAEQPFYPSKSLKRSKKKSITRNSKCHMKPLNAKTHSKRLYPCSVEPANERTFTIFLIILTHRCKAQTRFTIGSNPVPKTLHLVPVLWCWTPAVLSIERTLHD